MLTTGVLPPTPHSIPHHQRASAGQPPNSRAATKRKRTATDDAGTHANDDDFTADSTDDELHNDGYTDIMLISNIEVSSNDTMTYTMARRFILSRWLV
jgi:hypothetical protein